MTQTIADVSRCEARRRRAAELQERYAFASGVLSFYAQLLDVQEDAFLAASRECPQPENVALYAAQTVVPRVVELCAANGPPALVGSVVERFDEADFEEMLARWLHGEELSGIDRYIARASTAPVLHALGTAAGNACKGTKLDRTCPVCAGLPQLSFFAVSPEDLVTAHRYLECSRCESAWAFARMTCAYCGETESSRLQLYNEIDTPRFPHVRIDACSTCSRYLLNVDLGRDRRAVAQVDEIAAIPLDLYAKERGLRKVVPNIMGF
jgi:FdhE protein